MSETNLQIRLVARPVGLPRASDFQSEEGPIPEPGEGEFLVRNRFLSLDPAMRGWMREARSYIAPVALGDVMRGGTYGEVVRSQHPGFAPGDAVVGLLGWQRYALSNGEGIHPVPAGVTGPMALGVLGMTGLTAYFGLLDVGQPQSGETILVSGAAGATGSVVGQIGKLQGCRVVGIAGGPAKCAWLTDELGFDAAVDYKATDDLPKALREACPDGVDVYFDNVGGDVLDAALTRINRGARVVICGAISQYNNDETRGPKNYLALLVQRAQMRGFLVFDYAARYPEALGQLGQWVAAGQLRHREEIVDGLANAPAALLRLFDGRKQGKLVVRID